MQFSHIIDQYELINSLIVMADQKRVSHAHLFSGKQEARGFSVALGFAQYLNCTNKKRFSQEDNSLLLADSCGECSSCKKYEKLIHPDLHLIFPNTTTKTIDKNNSSELLIKEFRDFVLDNKTVINLDSWYKYLDTGSKQGSINVRDANNIIKTLSLHSYESQYKITIIWGCDKLHHEAAPKLLKIVEEPHPNTLFFFITDDIDAVLPTILSRLQLIKVPNVYPTQENNEFLALFADWIRLCFNYSTKIDKIFEIVEKELVILKKEEQKQFLDFAIKVFENSFLINLGLNTKDNILQTMDSKFQENFPKFVTDKNIDKIYKELDKTILHIERNGNAKIIFLDLSIQLGMLLTNK